MKRYQVAFNVRGQHIKTWVTAKSKSDARDKGCRALKPFIYECYEDAGENPFPPEKTT